MPRACPVDGYAGRYVQSGMPRACPVDGYAGRYTPRPRAKPNAAGLPGGSLRSSLGAYPVSSKEREPPPDKPAASRRGGADRCVAASVNIPRSSRWHSGRREICKFKKVQKGDHVLASQDRASHTSVIPR